MVAAPDEPTHPEMAGRDVAHRHEGGGRVVAANGQSVRITALSLAAGRAFWQIGRMTYRPVCLAALALMTSGLSAVAQSPMTASEFDAYSRGKTFYYGSAGAPYGVEQYFDNRRVRWSFLDGDCADGFWYEQSGMICFEYDATPNPGPQCWTFFNEPGGLVAQFQGDPSKTTLYEVQDADEPMQCRGPEVGV